MLREVEKAGSREATSAIFKEKFAIREALDMLRGVVIRAQISVEADTEPLTATGCSTGCRTGW